MLILLQVLVAAALSGWVMTRLVISFASMHGLYDTPSEDRRVHTAPIPRLGGVAVFAAMGIGLATAVLFGEFRDGNSIRFLMGIVAGSAILFATGVVDDVRGLRPATKLGAQSLAALVVYLCGLRIEVLSVGPTLDVHLGWLALPLTLLWVVGVTNAFNLIDGLDGLATGIALVALSTILVAASALGHAEVVLVCFALMGALVGFLFFNFNPARIFLGDGGSLFVGFMLAVLAVHGSLKSATAVLVIVPLFALALPLLDISLAVLRRWLRGIPLFGADARHIHHQLLRLGLTQRRAVALLYASAVALATLGISLTFAPPVVILWVATFGGGACLVFVLMAIRKLEYHELAVAGAVLAAGPQRARRMIQDRIHSHDVARIIETAATLDEVQAILEDNASAFGFLHMAIWGDRADLPAQLTNPNGQPVRASMLDYPIMPAGIAQVGAPVLRIWCTPGVRSRPYGAERVAGILGPVIERWLLERIARPADVVLADVWLQRTPSNGSPPPPVRPAIVVSARKVAPA